MFCVCKILTSTNSNVFDVGGSERCRALWYAWLSNTAVLGIVLDSADRVAMRAMKIELDKLCEHWQLVDVPFLFIANKQELDEAMSIEESKSFLFFCFLFFFLFIVIPFYFSTK